VFRFLNPDVGGGLRAYLERSEAQFKDQPLPLADILRREGEHSVVNTKQGNEQEGGARQTPEHTHTHTDSTNMLI